jgi:GNAT superfamily N-acetyltransferase
MTVTAPRIQLSAIDEERFGVRTARVSQVTLDQLDAIDAFCQVNQVRMLIARSYVYELPTVQAMQSRGYLLTDTLIYYSRRLAAAPIADYSGSVTIRMVQPEEAQRIADLTAQIFRNYRGHYHADPRLNPADCDAVYSSWAYRSVMSRQVADVVLVAEREAQIVGFISVRMNSTIEGEGALYGVDPAIQGHGIGRNLIIGALRWLEEHGAEKMVISTQITNISSQKVWVRLGFEPLHAQYTFHKWYD